MVMVGRADIQLAMSPRGPCPIQLWAAHIVPCRGGRGGRVQAQPKGVEPALSCAPTNSSTSVESCCRTCCPYEFVCHSLLATTICGLLRPRGRPGQAAVP